MASEAEALQTAVQWHQRGDFAQAERLYRQVLDANPWQPDALHLVGAVAHQTGRHPLAIQYISQAIAAHPAQPIYHNNLGEAYRVLGCLGEARRHFEKALSLDRNFAFARNNLGKTLAAQGDWEEAAVEFRRAVTCQPNFAEALTNLGNALVQLKRFDEAIGPLQTSLQLSPAAAEASCALGCALAGKSDPAAGAVLAESLRLPFDRSSAEAHLRRGDALLALGRNAEADEARGEAARIAAGKRPSLECGDLFCVNASHEHRAVLIHIPKNGGTSIKQALDMPAGGHFTWKHYATRHPKLWQEYTSFAVVRNPWDRVVSAYHQAKVRASHWYNDQTGMHPDFPLLRDKSFDECVEILSHDAWRLGHAAWENQAQYVIDRESPDRKVMAGALLRFENLGADFNAFCQQHGIRCTPLATVNASQRSRDYRAYYNDRTRQLVAEVYREDIEAFGYTF